MLVWQPPAFSSRRAQVPSAFDLASDAVDRRLPARSHVACSRNLRSQVGPGALSGMRTLCTLPAPPAPRLKRPGRRSRPAPSSHWPPRARAVRSGGVVAREQELVDRFLAHVAVCQKRSDMDASGRQLRCGRGVLAVPAGISTARLVVCDVISKHICSIGDYFCYSLHAFSFTANILCRAKRAARLQPIAHTLPGRGTRAAHLPPSKRTPLRVHIRRLCRAHRPSPVVKRTADLDL